MHLIGYSIAYPMGPRLCNSDKRVRSYGPFCIGSYSQLIQCKFNCMIKLKSGIPTDMQSDVVRVHLNIIIIIKALSTILGPAT